MTAHKVICVVGARPNFMKIAPIMHQLKKRSNIDALLVHTGQHYDSAMKEAFFTQLDIPEPNVDLGVGSGSHAVQTAEVMKRFETVLDKENPSAILVVGDVNSTIACSLVASKKGIKVIHVEAGLRSFDRKMPEEINRVLTDQISDLLFTTEADAIVNLRREGIDEAKVHFTGNVMIDTLLYQLKRATPVKEVLSDVYESHHIEQAGFGLLTLHRPSNVDHQAVLERVLQTVIKVSETLPIVFPVHPRTKKQIEFYHLDELLQSPNLITTEPLGYHQMLGLMSKARVVLTDSGGIQEETTALGVPCITLRENTERPTTVTQGTNTVVGTDSQQIMEVFADVMSTGGKKGNVPDKWDGKAAERIVEILNTWLDKTHLTAH